LDTIEELKVTPNTQSNISSKRGGIMKMMSLSKGLKKESKEERIFKKLPRDLSAKTMELCRQILIEHFLF